MALESLLRQALLRRAPTEGARWLASAAGRPAAAAAAASVARHAAAAPAAAALPSAAAAAAAAAASPLTWKGRAAYATAYCYVAVSVGALLANQSEALVALETYDVVIAKELVRPSSDAKLEKCLDVLARGLPLSTTLRAKLLGTEGAAAALVELARSAPTVRTRYHAAKALETLAELPAARAALLDARLVAPMAAAVVEPATLLCVRKALAAALAELGGAAAREALAGDRAARAQLDALVAAGALGAVDASLATAATARQRARGALRRMCDALGAEPGAHARTLAARPPAEGALVAARAAEAAAAAADGASGWRLGRYAPVVDSAAAALLEGGALMYLHTAAGGLVWGAFESARAGLGLRAVARHACVTSAVTCFLPICAVGGCVSLYARLEKATDTRLEKLAMYTAGALLVYPGWRGMQVVERLAPHWLGGHIVGFMSFFAYLHYAQSDLFRTDAQLLALDSNALAAAARAAARADAAREREAA
jgi:hypothetical protein